MHERKITRTNFGETSKIVFPPLQILEACPLVTPRGRRPCQRLINCARGVRSRTAKDRTIVTSTRIIVVEEGSQSDPAAADSHHHRRVEIPNQTQLPFLTELLSTTAVHTHCKSCPTNYFHVYIKQFDGLT